jgi:hypothetical protein
LLQLLGNDISKAINIFGELPEFASGSGVYIYYNIYLYVNMETLSEVLLIALPPNSCEVGGVTLDKNRDELVSIFGIPKSEWYDETGGPYSYYLMLDYEIEGRFVRICLPTSENNSELIKLFYSEPPQHYWRGQ